VAVTRARWIVGGLVGAAALAVGGEALFAYVAGGSVVGVVAVVVLVGVLGVGLASLARARRDVGRELAALATTPPGGALWAARRAQALELRSRGVEPDLDVLAEATAAEEAERGFAGKYLVATTILVGLVGTFGGLMETLSRVSPLLKGQLAADGPAGVLALLAGPLAGLHVTFGTSVVAILVTLALALVQGDVTLHHERLLAQLQERTRHVLVPELWPARESTAARAARALDELKDLVAASASKTAEATASRVAEVARAELARFVDAAGATLAGTATASRESMESAAAATRDAMTDAAMATREAMTGLATTTREAMSGLATATREVMTGAAAAVADAAAASAAALREDGERLRADGTASVATLLAETRRQQGDAAEGLARAAAALGEAAASIATGAEGAVAAMSASAERSSAAFTEAASTAVSGFSEAASAAVSGLAEVRAGVGGELGSAAQALAAATGELRGTAAEISPALAALAPQLEAMAREVALLAARADDPEPANAVLDELVRLGEDVERLVALAQPSASPAASDGEAEGAGA
jgi:hypothetical protein